MFESEILQLIGVGRTALRDWCSLGYFPPPVQLGVMRSSGRPAKVAWVREEVEQWIESRKGDRITYHRQLA
ncbi:helix-turn-helix transcriptional regulator [Pseudomonas plecoglossicida]|uniref:helix-turn-helix transcriptional regulator n=1 Tax=Pseudomonas plecoglossicida TaxID=70775 RepID=UPI00126A3C0C|nr:AlpA family phage regulatory protein [Pseudomonas plecoglossicida]